MKKLLRMICLTLALCMLAYQEALAKLGKLSAKPDIPAVRDFAADTSLRLLAGETENAVYSPVSLYLTLAMLADLSGGDTSQQVRQMLNLQDPEALRQQVQQLWMALYCDNGITTCRLAGSAWVAQGSTVHQAALDSLAGVHRCGVYQAAMGTQEANRAIAAWLDQQTGGLLQGDTGSIRTSPMELLRLYSTVYFKDGWLQEFAKEDTYCLLYTSDAADE